MCAPDYIDESVDIPCSPRGCPTAYRVFENGGEVQRQIVGELVEAFARGVLNDEVEWLHQLDPAYDLQLGIPQAHIEREYVPGMSNSRVHKWMTLSASELHRGHVSLSTVGSVTAEPTRLPYHRRDVLRVAWNTATADGQDPAGNPVSDLKIVVPLQLQ